MTILLPTHSLLRQPFAQVEKIMARLCLLCVAAVLCACSKTADLQSGLKDAEANEIIFVLDRNGIKAEKRTTKEGIALSVDAANVPRATEVLNAAGLPRRNLSSLGQMFKKEGMISTPLEERARYIHGLSAELEYTLQQFDRVISARVHVVLPERVAPGEPIQPSSAAVFVKYRPPLDEDMVTPRIRNLVASSIPGLSSDDRRSKVSVVLMASELETSTYQWTHVGPFQVLEESASLLRGILSLLIALALIGVALGGYALLKRNKKASAWLQQRVNRVAGSSRGAAEIPVTSRNAGPQPAVKR